MDPGCGCIARRLERRSFSAAGCARTRERAGVGSDAAGRAARWRVTVRASPGGVELDRAPTLLAERSRRGCPRSSRAAIGTSSAPLDVGPSSVMRDGRYGYSRLESWATTRSRPTSAGPPKISLGSEARVAFSAPGVSRTPDPAAGTLPRSQHRSPVPTRALGITRRRSMRCSGLGVGTVRAQSNLTPRDPRRCLRATFGA
jgi:hypothetical protein